MVRTALGLTIAASCVLLLAQAKPARSAVLSAPALYADALAKEQAVRKAWAAGRSGEAVLKAVRAVVSGYEVLVRRYPNSSYCDDALWNAAQVSLDAAKALRQPVPAEAVARLLTRLAAEYPASKFAAQVPALLESLDRRADDAAVVLASRTSAPSSPVMPPVAAVEASAAIPTLRAITRTVLPDVVRLTLELDAEVDFRQETLSGPPRLFFDFAGARPAAHLADRTLRFDDDADVVRQVRVGRQARDTVRVVLDTAGIASCSASPLYTPYRLVVDCVRAEARPEPPARPTPRTPASFARKPTAAGARTADAAVRPATAAKPTSRGEIAALAPPTPLSARATVSPMAVLAPLYARTTAARSATLQPSVGPRIPPAAFLAWASEPPPAAPPAPAVAAALPASLPPVAPARNLDGSYSIARQLGLRVSRIVIDPGHGGHDPGAQVKGLNEAALVLDIALRLETMLRDELGMDVVLTRRADEFIALEERTHIANRAGADLFLSIHANASSVSQAAGVETYFLNLATNSAAAAVAARENAASGQPMSALPDFVKAIALNSKVDESRDFATQVQRSLVQSLRPANQALRDLGVKQAPFVVLIGASMPSVLAEVSFITNDQEAKLLKGSSYRQRIAQALFAAVKQYQASLTRAGKATQD